MDRRKFLKAIGLGAIAVAIPLKMAERKAYFGSPFEIINQDMLHLARNKMPFFSGLGPEINTGRTLYYRRIKNG